jgi:phenylacetate-coenzyme A ligase PaaK-like adenylate-forming protein
VRKALFRAYAGLRARTLLHHLEALERTQWLSNEQMTSFQLVKLRETLQHAARAVPYYREMFQRIGFEPRGITSTADLRELPLLERNTLLERFEDLRAQGSGRLAIERASGGSTGRPVRFLVDKHEMTTRSAHIYRHLRWLGWDIGDRVAYVWGSDIDSREHKGWRGAIRDWISGVLWLDAFRLSEQGLDGDLDRLERFNPTIVIGYPLSLHLLARRAIERSRRLHLKGIETSAEQLMPEVRRDLASAFDCPVLDRYGCREAGVIAHECSEGSMHVNSEAVVVEMVEGEIVVTTLNNRVMPLIRYRVEDLVELTPEACSCGRGLPLVRRLHGRLSDIIRAPSGRLIHGEFFTHLFYGTASVMSFQVTQTSPADLEIRFVANSDFDLQARARIEAAIREHADAGFRVIWVPVDRIEPGPSGKFRFTISLVNESKE